MMTPLLVLLFLASVYCNEEIYRIPLIYKGYAVYEDIVLDREKNTMLVTPGNLDHIPGPLKSTINLHEFNTKYVAIKNVNKGHCTIVATHETMAMADAVIYNITKLHLPYPPNMMFLSKSKTKMTDDELLSIAGPRIVNFCRGYSSYRAYPSKPGTQSLHRSGLESPFEQVFCMVSPHLDETLLHQLQQQQLAHQSGTNTNPGKVDPNKDTVGK